jgi:hypothetical protein
LWGKERIIIFGRGHIILIARSARSTKSPSPLVREFARTSAPAMISVFVWIGFVGAGDERDVPRAHRGQHEVGQPLLRSDRGDRLRFRVEVHVVFPLVPVADGQPQLRDPAGKRITVVPGVADRLDKLVDDVFRRGNIGVSHPQVDDVLAGVAQFRLELHHDRENVRRQTLDSRELFHWGISC